MRFVIYSHITFFLKLPFRECFQKVFRDLPDSFRDSAFSTFFMFSMFFCLGVALKHVRESEEMHTLFRLHGGANLTGNLRLRIAPWHVHADTSLSSHQMSPGSQIALLGNCSFRMASVFLPDSWRHQFDSFVEPGGGQISKSWTFPSGSASVQSSGTFRIASGMRCFCILIFSFRFSFRIVFRNLPESFRDAVFQKLVTF